MRFSAICVACLMAGTGSALADPEILSLDAPENTSIREIVPPTVPVSPRPLPRPLEVASGAAEDGAFSWDAFPKDFLSGTYALQEEANVSQLRDLTPDTFQLASSGSVSLNFPVSRSDGPVLMIAAPAEPIVISPIQRATLGRLVNRYAEAEGSDHDDLERLFLVAEGKREVEPVRPEAVSIVESAYEAQPVSVDTNVAAAPEPAANTAEQLTNEQVMALIMTMAANRPQVPASYLMPQPVAPQPQPQPVSVAPSLDGIPSLDYRGEDLPEPAAIASDSIPAGASPFSPEVLNGTVPQAAAYQAQAYGVPAQYAAPYQQPMYQPSPPAVVGDGSNLLLAGWKVGLTGSGGVGMYIEGDPSSIVEISEGMVVGILGSVSEISFQNGEIIASFSSGESVRGPARIVMSTSGSTGLQNANEQVLPDEAVDEGTFSG